MAAANLNYEVHNYMEDIVFDLIQQKQQSDPEFDFCPRCILDICALVLNSVKPQYIKVKTSFDELDQTDAENLEQLVSQAAEKVRANPRHEQDSDDYQLQNTSEILVRQVLGELLEEQPQFQLDAAQIPIAAALVLNQTKPCYAVTAKGSAYKRTIELDHQFTPGLLALVYNVLNQLKDMNELWL